MPRLPAATHTPPPRESTSGDVRNEDALTILRVQWKWAAFSQFFFTFNHLFAMNDVSLSNVEDDLVNGTWSVLPRIMQRLLYVLSYDRKVTLHNWQTALRKQYYKRDPAANPIGPEPRAEDSRERESPPLLPEGSRPNHETSSHMKGQNGQTYPESSDEKEKQDHARSTRASTLDLDADTGSISVQPSEYESDGKQLCGNDMLDQEHEQQESKDWLELPMLVKLDSMHMLMEWQFQNPTRLRTLMRSDDEDASWRIEPIGYDAKKNAYWLIGGTLHAIALYHTWANTQTRAADRLWIQRHIPKPPRPKNSSFLKRKRGTMTTTAKLAPTVGKGRSGLAPDKRPRVSEYQAAVFPTSGRVRAAKAQAKIKLNKQAVEFAEFQRLHGKSRSARDPTAAARVAMGDVSVSPSKTGRATRAAMRASARIRGTGEDGWQAIPKEWLRETAGGSSASEDGGDAGEEGKQEAEVEQPGEKSRTRKIEKKLKTGLESDGSEISELTELSEECTDGEGEGEGGGDSGGNESSPRDNGVEAVVKEEKSSDHALLAPAADRETEDPPTLPEGFTEWETICVTLHEWEHIAERFEKGTHYSEKALYKVLVKSLVPTITAELRETERKQRLSTAITQRKRSSRLLLRQSEKEEAMAAARRVAEEAERNSRMRRQEARAKREEEAREKRELTRELRRRDKEKEMDGKSSDGVDGFTEVDVIGDEGSPTAAPVARENADVSKVNGKSEVKSGSRTPIGEEWELDCEVCHRRGVNLDDGTPMMSCGMCSKWQHITCHDAADQRAGRRRRNWDQVEFVCLQCRTKQDSAFRAPSGFKAAYQGHAPSQTDTSVAYPTIGPTLNGNPSAVSGTMQQPYTVNGSGASMHLHDYQGAMTSNMRSAAPAPQQPVHHLHSRLPSQRQHEHGPPISFTHYQPQQRGFSSSAQQMSYPSVNVQPYGQASFLDQHPQQYPIRMFNGSGSLQQQSSSQLPMASSPPAQHGRWQVPSPASFNQTRPQSMAPLESSLLNLNGLHHPQGIAQRHYHPSQYRPAPT